MPGPAGMPTPWAGNAAFQGYPPMKPRNDRWVFIALRVVAIVALVVGLGMAAGGVGIRVHANHEAAQRSATTTGLVVTSDVAPDYTTDVDNDGTACQLRYAFTAGGQDYQNLTTEASSSYCKYQTGEQIRVAYDPKDPSDNVFKDGVQGSKIAMWVLAGIGGFIALIGLLALIVVGVVAGHVRRKRDAQATPPGMVPAR
jgi:hypothetical protein